MQHIAIYCFYCLYLCRCLEQSSIQCQKVQHSLPKERQKPTQSRQSWRTHYLFFLLRRGKFILWTHESFECSKITERYRKPRHGRCVILAIYCYQAFVVLYSGNCSSCLEVWQQQRCTQHNHGLFGSLCSFNFPHVTHFCTWQSAVGCTVIVMGICLLGFAVS